MYFLRFTILFYLLFISISFGNTSTKQYIAIFKNQRETIKITNVESIKLDKVFGPKNSFALISTNLDFISTKKN